tara:strand:+ start:7 stop:369 length:363 start_codon:yes stop_codon:yes gene_type:complete
MDKIIIILLILLTLSILNNFLMYKYGYTNECPTQYVQSAGLPKNVKFKTITFFYKDKLFNKCLNSDYLLETVPDRNEGEVAVDRIISQLDKDKILWVSNPNNSNELTINEVNHSNMLKLY